MSLACGQLRLHSRDGISVLVAEVDGKPQRGRTVSDDGRVGAIERDRLQRAGDERKRPRHRCPGAARAHFHRLALAERGLQRQRKIPLPGCRCGRGQLAGTRFERDVFARWIPRCVTRAHVEVRARIVGADPLAIGGDGDAGCGPSSEDERGLGDETGRIVEGGADADVPWRPGSQREPCLVESGCALAECREIAPRRAQPHRRSRAGRTLRIHHHHVDDGGLGTVRGEGGLAGDRHVNRYR